MININFRTCLRKADKVRIEWHRVFYYVSIYVLNHQWLRYVFGARLKIICKILIMNYTNIKGDTCTII